MSKLWENQGKVKEEIILISPGSLQTKIRGEQHQIKTYEREFHNGKEEDDIREDLSRISRKEKHIECMNISDMEMQSETFSIKESLQILNDRNSLWVFHLEQKAVNKNQP